MKILFYWLLKKYSTTEKERVEILKILDNKVRDNYCEQTTYGNVYNYFIEFIMANPFIVKCVKEKDTKSLEMLKSGISKAFEGGIIYIHNDYKRF
jgi:hypothetical protein